jgi:BolA protein
MDRRVGGAVTEHFFGVNMTIRQDIINKLSLAFPIEYLEVINESYKHNVPEGAESHFKVMVVSSAFEGKKPVARHRLVNGILAKILSIHIHALALHTMTKEEWSISQQAPASPPCLGGGARQ